MLGPVIGDLLPSALGVALSPFPIVAVILMLTTPRGRANGPAFAVGWVVGLTVLCLLVLWLAGGSDDPDSDTSTAVDVLQLVLGLGLLAVAKKQWDKRPVPGEAPVLPKWMDTLQDFDVPRALAVGVALAAVNPKNLALTLAGAAAIAQGGLSAGGDAVAIAVFVLLASMTVIGPVLSYLLLGKRVEPGLVSLRQWMADNNATIMTVVCVILAAKLVGAGIAGLSN